MIGPARALAPEVLAWGLIWRLSLAILLAVGIAWILYRAAKKYGCETILRAVLPLGLALTLGGCFRALSPTGSEPLFAPRLQAAETAAVDARASATAAANTPSTLESVARRAEQIYRSYGMGEPGPRGDAWKDPGSVRNFRDWIEKYHLLLSGRMHLAGRVDAFDDWTQWSGSGQFHLVIAASSDLGQCLAASPVLRPYVETRDLRLGYPREARDGRPSGLASLKPDCVIALHGEATLPERPPCSVFGWSAKPIEKALCGWIFSADGSGCCTRDRPLSDGTRMCIDNPKCFETEPPPPVVTCPDGLCDLGEEITGSCPADCPPPVEPPVEEPPVEEPGECSRALTVAADLAEALRAALLAAERECRP